MSYAKNTAVPVDRSKAEIESVLTRYGADGFAYASEGSRAIIAFKIDNRMVQITLPLPDRNDPAFKPKRSRFGRSKEDRIFEAWNQACRSSWRSLLLVIKAKLEAVSSGISTIEREFFVDIVMPNGKTLGQWAQPQIETAYKSGKMPPLLSLGDDK